MSTTTTQMGLKVPQINDPSPGYVNDIAATFATLDAHDHSSGKGTPISQSGLSFTGALSMGTQNIQDIRALKFSPVGFSIVPSEAGELALLSSTDLSWITPGSIAVVPLTNNGRGGGNLIGGDYYANPLASINYTGSSSTYAFTNNSGAQAKGAFGSVQFGGNGVQLTNDSVNGGLAVLDNGGLTTNLNMGATARLAGSYINWDGTQFNLKDASNTLAKGNFGSIATSGAINAVGGILQGSRIVALRGLVKAASLNGSTSTPIQAYTDGTTPAFAQTTFTAPYAGSIAAITMRAYGANGTAGTINGQTSGLSLNAVTGNVSYTGANSLSTGFSVTFSPGTYTFAANVAFTLNLVSTGWTQVTTGATGVEATVWVYC